MAVRRSFEPLRGAHKLLVGYIKRLNRLSKNKKQCQCEVYYTNTALLQSVNDNQWMNMSVFLRSDAATTISFCVATISGRRLKPADIIDGWIDTYSDDCQTLSVVRTASLSTMETSRTTRTAIELSRLLTRYRVFTHMHARVCVPRYQQRLLFGGGVHQDDDH